MGGQLKIGGVAARAGVSVDTIRFYERRGVLPKPQRRQSGYRIYEEGTVERLKMVKHLQTLGFSLDDIIEVLRMVDAGTANCATQKFRFEAVLTRIDEEIAELRTTRRKIVRTLRSCQEGTCAWVGCD